MNKWKISNYIVAIDDVKTGKKVIYSLRTARFAEIDRNIYEDIFEKFNYSEEYSDIITSLVDKKIIVDINEDELAALNDIRGECLKKENDSATTHYIITPTMECNARCYYCFEHGAHHQTMSMDMADDVADFMIKKSKGNPVSIYWYGGEPLMGTEQIDRISDILRTAGIDFSSRITSNGYYLNSENIDKAINRWNVEMIQIPIDDIGEAYNKVKNYKKPHVDNPFDLVLNNVECALDAGIRVRIRINFHPFDMESISRISEYICNRFQNHPNLMFHFKPIGADNIPWMTELPWDGENSLEKYFELSNKYVKHRKKAPITEGMKIGKSRFKKTCLLCDCKPCIERTDEIGKLLRDYDLLPKNYNCGGVTNHALAIDSCGSLYTCHLMLGQDYEKYSSGTIYTDLFQNDVTRNYQSLELNESCKKCKLLPVCQGGCKYREFRYVGKENRCVMYKYHLEELIALIVKIIHEQKLIID